LTDTRLNGTDEVLPGLMVAGFGVPAEIE